LLESPVKLPFLNVELPLLAFFALAPFVVLITHIYALMHFRMLGNKARHFHKVLRDKYPGEGDNKEIRGNKRRLLPSSIFVQILAGPPELRAGFFGFMLKVIALTTLVLFPVLVLLLLQIQFLPFHDTRITWAQRGALFVDVLLLWPLRPPVLADLSVESFGRARLRACPRRGHEHERQETALAWLDRQGWLVSTHKLLFAGEVDDTTRRRKSLFSNTLVLPGFNLYEALKIDDPKKRAWKEHLYGLRGRHLEQAAFTSADLTKADASLSTGQLQGALLDFAQLQGAYLESAELQGALLDFAQLQGAVLIGAQLQGATLDDAQLQGAVLAGAQLGGASLNDAQLQGAALVGVEVRATDFSGAFLRRTKIDSEQLGAVRLNDPVWTPV
jgi:uncharacterized protein YjbI with pentapeptide repeats